MGIRIKSKRKGVPLVSLLTIYFFKKRVSLSQLLICIPHFKFPSFNAQSKVNSLYRHVFLLKVSFKKNRAQDNIAYASFIG